MTDSITYNLRGVQNDTKFERPTKDTSCSATQIVVRKAKQLRESRESDEAHSKTAKAEPIEAEENSQHLQIEFIDEDEVLAMAAAESAYRFPAKRPLPLVKGFNFPISDEDTVELLEATVQVNAQVREEYINLLKAKKPQSVKVVNIFHALFQDEAMYGYNFSGICHRGPRRKAMQNYTIFVDCMLEAWQEHGIDETALKEALSLAIKNINGRKRNRKYFARKKIRNKNSNHNV
ncbi:uncharacterized protein LOC128745671 [Sabethes cyaneus]|uniref:uncharacterized protein LOC128745671 n=1 Tax=Sabethes cyaneus TaxID=53552 RepID=UPI00237E777A|nr:uncharacterized protein LOC128745671 [Sabethes cyaneus]